MNETPGTNQIQHTAPISKEAAKLSIDLLSDLLASESGAIAKSILLLSLEPTNADILFEIARLLYKAEDWNSAAILSIQSAYRKKSKREGKIAFALASLRNANPNSFQPLASLKESFIGKTLAFDKCFNEVNQIHIINSQITSFLSKCNSDTLTDFHITNYSKYLNTRLNNFLLLNAILAILSSEPSSKSLLNLCNALINIPRNHGIFLTKYIDLSDFNEQLIDCSLQIHSFIDFIEDNPTLIHWALPLILSNLFIGNLFFKEYILLRDLSIVLIRAQLENTDDPDEVKQMRILLLNHEFESGEFSIVCNPESLHEAKIVEYSRSISSHSKENTTLLQSKNSNFSKFIKGKTCAIVGSAYTKNSFGKEIDDFEVIVRINYRDCSIHSNIERYGSRVNISYYNSGDTITFRDEVKNILPYLDWAVFKNKKDVEDFSSLTNTKLLQRNISMFKGAPNGIQNALYEIHLSNPKRIKLFNTTFYCSTQNYEQGYRPGHSLKGRNWVVHDAVSNFAYVYKLWVNNCIEVDPECEAILKQGVNGYINSMDHLYSPSYVG